MIRITKRRDYLFSPSKRTRVNTRHIMIALNFVSKNHTLRTLYATQYMPEDT